MEEETIFNILMRITRTPHDGGWDYTWAEHLHFELWWPEAVNLNAFLNLGVDDYGRLI